VGLIHTILWMKLRLTLNRSRTAAGAMNTIMGLILTGFMAFIVLLLALLAGLLTYGAARGGDADMLYIIFNIVLGSSLGIALFLPILLSSGEVDLDPRKFLVFPVSHKKLFGLLLFSSVGEIQHLFYLPILMAVYLTGFLLQVRASLSAALILVLFTVFTFSWAMAFSLFLQGVLRHRRIREIFVVFVAFLFLTLCFLPQIFFDSAGQHHPIPFLSELKSISAFIVPWIPSVAASRVLKDLFSGIYSSAAEPAFFLLLGDLLGIFVAYRLFGRVVLQPGSSGEGRSREECPKVQKTGLFDRVEQVLARWVKPQVAAIWMKDFRYLLRSSPGKLNLLLIPVITIFVLKAFLSKSGEGLWGLSPHQLGFLGLSAYTAMLATNFINNTFAWEHSGIKTYFFVPVSPRSILLGKNLGTWSYSVLLFLMLTLTLTLVSGFPGLFITTTSLLTFAAITLIFTCVGNILSILFPKKNDISSWKMSATSSTSALVNILSLVVAMGLVSPAVILPASMGYKGLVPVTVGGLLVLLSILYGILLRASGRLLVSRREDLIQVLR